MTTYHIIKPTGEVLSDTFTGELEYGTPAFSTLRQMVGVKENESLEHVSVLFRGKRAHMFVDEEGRLHRLPRNEKATRVYYNNTIARMGLAQYMYDDLSVDPVPGFVEDPGFDIVGTAVLWEGDME